MAKPKIFLSGGGTMGSVMPLVALYERVKGDFDCIWIGSRRGVEKPYIKGLGIKYEAIASAKFRRYFSFRTIFAPVFVFLGLLESLALLVRLRPEAVIVSGSFISVPLVFAAWILRIRIIVHQEDLQIGVAGRLTIPLASAVTCAFPETLKEIKNKNKNCIGNPVREAFKNPEMKKWQGDLPLILVLGGGLGSGIINRAIADIVPALAGKARILHLTGKNKTIGLAMSNSYTQVDGLWDEELAGAMAASDIVVSRAGLSTISELAFLSKPIILIPYSYVGQDKNAKYLEERNAAVVIYENQLENLQSEISDLLYDKNRRDELSCNIKNIFPPRAADKLADLIK